MPRVFKKLTFEGGVNRFDNSRSIRDDQAYTLKNVIPIGPGVMGTRGGLSPSAEVISGVALGITSSVAPLAALFPPRAVGTINLVLAYLGVDSGGAGANTRLWFVGTVLGGATTVSQSAAAMTLERRPSMTYFNKKVYCLVGTPLTGRSGYVLAEDGSALGYGLSDFNFNGTQTTRPIPAGMCGYRRRAVFWDLGTGYEDYIVFSDPDDPATVGDDILDSDGRAFRVGSRDAGRVMHCREVMLNAVGSPAQSALLVLRERAAYLLTGEPNRTTDVTEYIPPDMITSKFNVDCGCVAGSTVVETPHGIFWASEDDVWCWRAGQIPFRVGTHIQNELRNQNPAGRRWLMHAEYFNGFYRLAMQSISKTAAQTDPCDRQWWLDIRYGAPEDFTKARWFGPHQYDVHKFSGSSPVTGTFCMFRERRENKEDILYGLHPAANATVYAINMVKYDQFTNEDYSSLAVHDPTYRRNNNLIAPLILSKQFDFDDHGVEKIWTGVEADMMVDVAARVSIGDAIDATTSTATEDLAGDSSFDNDSDADNFRQTLFYPDEGTRPLGRKHQFSMSYEAGYVIDSTNNKVSIENNAGVVTEYTLTSGYYETLYQLLQHICSVLADASAAGSPDWTHNIVDDENTRAQYVIITSTATWKPRGAGISTAAAALWELIGYTSGGAWGAYQLSQTANAEVAWQQCAKMRFGGMMVSVNPVPRRVDGA
jgi:hypothetical protein